MSAVVAERQLDFVDGERTVPGWIRVLQPEPDGNNWRCRYQIEWPGYEREFGIMGIDSLQALVLALRIIPSAVGSTEDFKAGKIGCFGKRLNSIDDLGKEIGLTPIDVKQ
jgi:hypothetical protein